jgi:hypothetical protein
MTDDKDPMLQLLFAEAEQDLAPEAFTARVMAETKRLKRRAVIGWLCAAILVAAGLWLFATPLQAAIYLLNQTISIPLIDLGDSLTAQMLSPVNNIATLCVPGLFGLWFFLRRVFS